jgi:hypothetical protein
MVLWYVNPLLGNDREITIQQPLLGNGRKSCASNNGGTVGGCVFCAVCAEVI